MLNYIMKPPSNESKDKELVMVVTEGLNDDTVFRKYMKKFGEGIHHFGKLCVYTSERVSNVYICKCTYYLILSNLYLC